MTFQQYPFKGGIPSGNTAGRPGSPVIGDTYYNGQLEILEIYNGTAWVAISAPAATPQIISVTDASTGDAYTSTAGKLAVVFQAGVGGSTPTQYNAFTTAGGFSASSSSTTVTLTGLTPATEYIVYGNAQNNFGTTVNTPNFAGRTPTTLPEVRTIGTASTNPGTTDVTVTWTNGNNGGKALTSITITPFLNGTTAQTSQNAATTSSTSHTFTGLAQGSSYTFKVKATNANGTCADSTATNSVTLPVFLNVDYLVVAGGGSGGRGIGGGGNWNETGGGGGAGGLRSTITGTGGSGSLETALSVASGTNYTVTVGAGGAIGGNATAGSDGNNSVFSTITSTGGGGGGRYNQSGRSGGSGGGAGCNSSSGISGGAASPSGQGFGGGSPTTNNEWGSGGGGASEAGANAIRSAEGSSPAGGGGKGGDGRAVSITGTSVTYAGGGGGSSYYASNITPAGGAGGGGAGAKQIGAINGVSGTANTGGGGGGGGQDAVTGGNGGSGIVILRYPNTRTITVGAGLTAGVTNQSVGTNERYTTLTAGSGNVSWS